MINKIYKTIHNKYSRFFRFIFFLRYLFAIFFISISLFLSIPNFFDYEKRALFVKNHLLKHYDLEISEYDKIEFQALPIPKLNFENVILRLGSNKIKTDVKNLIIYPKFISIYNFENFQSNKIIFKDKNIILNDLEIQALTKYYFKQKKNFFVDNLNLKIKDKAKSVIDIKKINFSNFGYNKHLITGEIFGKKFKAKTNNNYKNINFRLLNSGFIVDVSLEEEKKDNFVKGTFKSKILNTNLKFTFDYGNNELNIFNAYFRSKNLSFKNNSHVIFNPFLEVNSNFIIDEIEFDILKKLNLESLLKHKNLIKELNFKGEIQYETNKFSNNLIDQLNSKIDLAYGRLNYYKKFSISENSFICDGDVNLLEEYPLLYFNCIITLNNKKRFLKKFSIKTKDKSETLSLKVEGNLNILSNKINFKNISMNKDYEASKEDLSYFKDNFETIIFDESFFKIFDYEKFKRLILEIS